MLLFPWTTQTEMVQVPLQYRRVWLASKLVVKMMRYSNRPIIQLIKRLYLGYSSENKYWNRVTTHILKMT